MDDDRKKVIEQYRQALLDYEKILLPRINAKMYGTPEKIRASVDRKVSINVEINKLPTSELKQDTEHYRKMADGLSSKQGLELYKLASERLRLEHKMGRITFPRHTGGEITDPQELQQAIADVASREVEKQLRDNDYKIPPKELENARKDLAVRREEALVGEAKRTEDKLLEEYGKQVVIKLRKQPANGMTAEQREKHIKKTVAEEVAKLRDSLPDVPMDKLEEGLKKRQQQLRNAVDKQKKENGRGASRHQEQESPFGNLSRQPKVSADPEKVKDALTPLNGMRGILMASLKDSDHDLKTPGTAADGQVAKRGAGDDVQI